MFSQVRGHGRERGLLLGTVLVLAGIAPATAQIVFSKPVYYAAGYFPRFSAVADFNGDGWPDIATTTSGTLMGDTAVLLLNDGQGGFLPPEFIFTSRVGSGVIAAGDYDGDGNLDLAVTTGPNVNLLLDNDGTGHFVERSGPVTVGFAREVFLSDFNRDGMLDWVARTTIGPYDAALEYAANLGGGVFGPTQRVIVYPADPALRLYPTGMQIADLDGNGISEYVFSAHSKRSFVSLEWNGQKFRTRTSLDVGAVEAVAFLEADGNPGLDAIFVNHAFYQGGPGRALRLATNDGLGRLLPQREIDVPEGTFVVAAADFDGDGLTDLATVQLRYRPYLTVFRQAQLGAFSPSDPINFLGYPYAISTADLNRDNKPDILVGGGNGSIVVFYNESP